MSQFPKAPSLVAVFFVGEGSNPDAGFWRFRPILAYLAKSWVVHSDAVVVVVALADLIPTCARFDKAVDSWVTSDVPNSNLSSLWTMNMWRAVKRHKPRHLEGVLPNLPRSSEVETKLNATVGALLSSAEPGTSQGQFCSIQIHCLVINSRF